MGVGGRQVVRPCGHDRQGEEPAAEEDEEENGVGREGRWGQRRMMEWRRGRGGGGRGG
jgi:hypothetical protein